MVDDSIYSSKLGCVLNYSNTPIERSSRILKYVKKNMLHWESNLAFKTLFTNLTTASTLPSCVFYRFINAAYWDF